MKLNVSGLNLERLLRAASQSGIVLRSAFRTGAGNIQVCLRASEYAAFCALCSRCGWETEILQEDATTRMLRFLRSRKMLALSVLVGFLLVALSSQVILSVRIEDAGAYAAEIRRFLAEERIKPGRMRAGVSADELRGKLRFRFPGLSYAGVSYAGSTLLIECRQADEGERTDIPGQGNDIVAVVPGIVTKIVALSGTPLVSAGEAVRRGQVLIRGEERAEKGGMRSVRAEGAVLARVWSEGSAKVSLKKIRTVETGRTRRVVTLRTPWLSCLVRDAEPFDSQDTSLKTQSVVGLFLPLWREIETLFETNVFYEPRLKAQAASSAQAAAEEIAKKQCPPQALILDKSVDYSMIDNEFVYATVVLEYEAAIAGRVR